MAKKMVIDGVVYIAKEEYDKEIVERKAKELGGIEEKALIEAMLKTRGYAFSRIVKEVAKKKIILDILISSMKPKITTGKSYRRSLP
ncbi:hypothetical protein [Bacillus licheniformis]|uniref:hypothetical protein n=1 Tax=Bacillus licheniformis TaxID=1402 RepID=UPI00092A0D40|nr:hypothetical protein [Bacillus licheniformis]OJT57357.1 hypothetical protein BFP47_11655 [Bacillus licheniformis]OJT70001.1 hypothetical protein BFP46_05235 [Bacillus licheniformis]